MVKLYGQTVWSNCMVKLYGQTVWYNCMVKLYGAFVCACAYVPHS
jgi:hypothetical protein